MPYSLNSALVIVSTTSSVTACSEAAMSMWNCSRSSDSCFRAGRPNRFANRSFVILRPVAYSK